MTSDPFYEIRDSPEVLFSSENLAECLAFARSYLLADRDRTMRYVFLCDPTDSTDFIAGTAQQVFVFPTSISQPTAVKVMQLDGEMNKNGRFNIYTSKMTKAYTIAKSASGGKNPVGPECENKEGYMMHYHVYNRATPAHAYYLS